MASAATVLSREETNFLRVANLLIRLSPQAVRILFDREFNPGGLKSIFSQNWTKLDKLKKKHVITQKQWNLLFPSGDYIGFYGAFFNIHITRSINLPTGKHRIIFLYINTRYVNK